MKRQVIEYLLTIQPEDHVGVYAIGDTVEVLRDYTSDSRHLLEQLASYNSQNPLSPALAPTPLLTDCGDQQMAEMIAVGRRLTSTGMSRNERDIFAIRQTVGALDALEAIAAHLP